MSKADRLALAFQSAALLPPESGGIFFLNAAPSGVFAEIAPAQAICEQPRKPVFDQLLRGDLEVVERLDGGSPAQMTIISLSRNRQESLGLIARAVEITKPGGTIVVEGAKTDGIDAIGRQLARHFEIEGTFIKAHGRVLWFTRPETQPEILPDWAAHTRPKRNSDGFYTLPGLFSHERVDPGSALLAEQFQSDMKGRVADLGAGWGWLSLTALERAPGLGSLDLFEADARALECARQNISDPRAQFHWADVTQLTDKVPPFDVVLSNPPFHQSREKDVELGAAFIAAAARLLKPSGRFLMVANRQLPYENHLEATFGRWDRIAENRHYKVMSASHPGRRQAEHYRRQP